MSRLELSAFAAQRIDEIERRVGEIRHRRRICIRQSALVMIPAADDADVLDHCRSRECDGPRPADGNEKNDDRRRNVEDLAHRAATMPFGPSATLEPAQVTSRELAVQLTIASSRVELALASYRCIPPHDPLHGSAARAFREPFGSACTHKMGRILRHDSNRFRGDRTSRRFFPPGDSLLVTAGLVSARGLLDVYLLGVLLNIAAISAIPAAI